MTKSPKCLWYHRTYILSTVLRKTGGVSPTDFDYNLNRYKLFQCTEGRLKYMIFFRIEIYDFYRSRMSQPQFWAPVRPVRPAGLTGRARWGAHRGTPRVCLAASHPWALHAHVLIPSWASAWAFSSLSLSFIFNLQSRTGYTDHPLDPQTRSLSLIWVS